VKTACVSPSLQFQYRRCKSAWQSDVLGSVDQAVFTPGNIQAGALVRSDTADRLHSTRITNWTERTRPDKTTFCPQINGWIASKRWHLRRWGRPVRRLVPVYTPLYLHSSATVRTCGWCQRCSRAAHFCNSYLDVARIATRRQTQRSAPLTSRAIWARARAQGRNKM
jgi:hypothetical protein